MCTTPTLFAEDRAMSASTMTVPRFPRAAAVAVTLWLALALVAGATGFLVRLSFPGPQIIILALLAGTLVAATSVPALRAWIDALPLRTLIGINAVRFVGITFGLLDLVVAVGTATAVTLRGTTPGITAVLSLPLVVIPTFFVPLFLASHVVIFRRLVARGSGKP